MFGYGVAIASVCLLASVVLVLTYKTIKDDIEKPKKYLIGAILLVVMLACFGGITSLHSRMEQFAETTGARK